MPFSIIRAETAQQSDSVVVVPAAHSLHAALNQAKALLEPDGELEVHIVVSDDVETRTGRDLFPGLQQFIAEACAEDAYIADASTEDANVDDFLPEDAYAKEYGGLWVGRALEDAALSGSVPPKRAPRSSAALVPCVLESADTASPCSLDDLLEEIDAPFSTTLLAIIDERGLADAEVYKRANISRQHFSKIRNNPDYQPTKRTVLALAVALELDLDETESLLSRAGLALSSANKADLIVEWFIMRGNYDIFAINEALYAYDQPILG